MNEQESIMGLARDYTVLRTRAAGSKSPPCVRRGRRACVRPARAGVKASTVF